MAELWDLFDRYKRPLGKTQYRGTPIAKGEYNLVVNIMTVNSQGQILCTKRDQHKHYGGLWEITGGSKIAGETSVEGARRELFEETGISAEENELEYRGDFRGEYWFHDYYLLKKDVDINDIVLQEFETVEAKWFEPSELLQLCRRGEFAGAPEIRLVAMYPEVFEKNPIVSGIHHISLKALGKENLEKAIDFYCGKLGLILSKRWNGGAMIDAGNAVIEIFECSQKLPDGVIKHFALKTDNVDRCVEIARSAGCEVLVAPDDREIPARPPMPIRIAFVRGPLGEQIEFFCER